MPEIEVDDAVLFGAKVLRDSGSGVELYLMPLPVSKGKSVARESLGLGDGEGGGGVEAAGKQDDRAFHSAGS